MGLEEVALGKFRKAVKGRTGIRKIKVLQQKPGRVRQRRGSWKRSRSPGVDLIAPVTVL